MAQTLIEIAQKLKDTDKKVQLIYAFNGMGKTRLSREFKELISSRVEGDEEADITQTKILYYNAFTEDLFYWDNDLEDDTNRKFKIQPNGYTQWVLQEQGQDQNAITYFQHYTSDKLTPHFNTEYIKREDDKEVTIKAFSEVTFSFERGDDTQEDNIKISKAEESVFIWSIFFSLIDQVVNILNVAEESERETDQFNDLKYIFIDDPVTSLDENHLIELAVNLAQLIKSSTSDLKFVITTHNTLFYNVLFNELGSKVCYMLSKLDDGTFLLEEKSGDSNRSFSYHLHIMNVIKHAIEENKVEKYHFSLLRNLYEKTASFLGYKKWSDLLPDDKEAYLKRIMNFASHYTLSNETVAEPTNAEKETVKFLLNHLIDNYSFWKEEIANA